MKKFKQLSRNQRQLTPPAFADFLVSAVWAMMGSEKIAVLWAHRKSPYWQFWPYVEMYGVGRDARTYVGPWPIIAHPPCGPWGMMKGNCFQDKRDGIIAMEMVHRFGGVVEHPVGSSLFRLHGNGGQITKCNQVDFGHMAKKPTLLYWWKPGFLGRSVDR